MFVSVVNGSDHKEKALICANFDPWHQKFYDGMLGPHNEILCSEIKVLILRLYSCMTLFSLLIYSPNIMTLFS